jgi:D-alanyl-D-alanine carboxypeptidase (penicillin-binding protein 5/6)
MLRAMAFPVLERVEQRRERRRQVRLRRLTALLVLAAAAGSGVWFGREARHAAAVPLRAAATAGIEERVRPQVRHPARERLVFGAPLLRHRFAPGLGAASAILVDAATGRVLWALHPHARRRIASTTKIMTALLALRRLGPRDLVTVDPSVPRVPLVKEGLRRGERVRAWKLFYGLLLFSGNDDALALAIASAGSRPAFVDEMNAEARTLGMHDTHFAGPSGVVDHDNYSSAWDLAALTRVAMRDPRFRAIVRTRVKRVAWSAPTFAKVYLNKNLLLWRYRGATGVKTGYTSKSGPCIVATATRERTSLIAVVLDSGNEYVDAARLLNLGFRELR